MFGRLKQHSQLVCKLARLSEIKTTDDRPENAIMVSGGDLDAFIPIATDFNVDLEKERINKSLSKIEIESQKLLLKLNNKDFMKRAPDDVIEKFEKNHKELKLQLDKQSRILENLESLK